MQALLAAPSATTPECAQPEPTRYQLTSWERVVMSKQRFSGRRGLVLAGILMALGGGAWANAPGDQPLLSIVSPQFNSTQNSAQVTVRVHFGGQAIPTSFHAEVDGNAITNLFAPTGNCDEFAHCDMQAVLPAASLLAGTNIITAVVNGPNQSAAADRTSFEFTGPTASAEPVSRMVPAVSVQSVYLPPNGNPASVGSYQILVGPGPGVPQRVYTTAGLGCSAGINSMQVLVLKSQTLAPETVGYGGQVCLSNSVQVANFLKSLPKQDVVIVNSFKGSMSNVDTTAIGGTRYTTPTPFYSAIGVVGAKAGSA